MRGFVSAASVVLIGTLAACGGGGGGGGGGFPVLPVSQAAPAPESSVSVGGTKLTADASGAYAVKPGDLVSIQIGSDVIWTSASEVPNAVTLQNPQIGNRSWSATLLHDGSTEDKFVLTAKYGSGPNDVLSITFKVAAADSRNGTYRLFSGTGTEFNFKVNFDLKQYVLLDHASTLIRAGTLANDPSVVGTYLMVDDTTKSLPSNNARFRVDADAIVGAMWVPIPFTTTPPNALYTYPFIATRSLVTDKSGLDGLYNRLDLTLTPGSGGAGPNLSSLLHETRISAGGTLLDQCNEVGTISNLTSCAGAGGTLVHYTAAATADADGHWIFTNNADANDKLVFAVARIAGDNVLLEAGTDALTPANHVFRVGVPSATAWPTSVAYGGSITSDWSKYRIGATSIDVDSTALDSTTHTQSYPLTDPTLTQPQGWKMAGLGVGFAYAMQGKGLYVLMGSPSFYNGYVHLGLLD